MQTEFINPPISFRPNEPVETPYLRAKEEWDRRIGTTVVQAKNWRLGFFSCALLALIMTGLNAYQLTQRKVVPFIVSVNPESGEAAVIGKALEINYTPKEQEIKYFLSQFIQNVRSVPSDPVVIKRNWLTAYLFLRKQAANLLNEMTNSSEDSPAKKIGEQTIMVKPISVVRVGDSNSFQARWKESRFSKNGAPIEEYTMAGVFSVEVETPGDEQTLTANPLGIFITNFQWNREL